MHLFTYGTLMFPEIWQRVVAREVLRRPAVLKGYVAYRVVGDSFPVLVPGSATVETPGAVYFDLDDQAFERLDAHESDLYERRETDVTLDNGEQVSCQVYILAERNRRFASSKRWTAEWFREEAMNGYIARHWRS
jgi:gamma-glutamylcyclotransferase (GGCT)/AIG2-like uncharacterized protein YtfP